MRLATWNVLNGQTLSDASVDPARLPAEAATLRADVLGMQEIDRGQPRSHLRDMVADVAASIGAPQWRFEPSLIGTPGGQYRRADDGDGQAGNAYGVGLVSRYPVRSWQVLRMSPARVRSPILLPNTHRVLWLQDEPRVTIAAVLDGPYGLMTVATTHLSFVPGWNALQLRRVVQWMRQWPGPQVLLGDLNMPATAARSISGWQLLARGATYPAPNPRVQLDHALGHGALPPVVGSERPALTVSDHRPLVVELA